MLGAPSLDQERPTQGYLTPPKELLDVVDRPPEPSLSFSPDRRRVLQIYRPPPMPPISELARPEVKLAGARACCKGCVVFSCALPPAVCY